jgi:hypothetical protein
MAISATFVADFTAFSAGVAKADAEIRRFESHIKDVGKGLSRFANEFSGTKVIKEAVSMQNAIEEIGGVSKLTAAELQRAGTTAAAAVEKMKLMGIDVPPKLRDLAAAVDPLTKNLGAAGKAMAAVKTSFAGMMASFSGAMLIDRAVSSLIGFGVAAFDSAGQIADLSANTGLSTDAIQEMQHVAEQTGSSLETFTKAAQKLGLNLASGTETAKRSVDQLGLSWDALRRQSPEDQFRAVMDALGKIEDVNKRNQLGVALLGRSFLEMGNAAVTGYGEVASQARIASEKQIQALDDAGDKWTEFKRGLSTGFISAMANSITFFEDLDRRVGAAADKIAFELGRIKEYQVAGPQGDIELKGPPQAPGPDDAELDAAEKARERRQQEQQRAAEAFAAAREEIFRGDINAAEALVAKIGDVDRIYELSNEQQIQYFKTLDAGMEQAIRRGEQLTATAVKMHGALSSAVMGIELPDFLKKERAGIGAAGWLPPAGDMKEALTPPIRLVEELTGKIGELTSGSAIAGQALREALVPPPNSINAFEGVFSGIKTGFKDLWAGMSGGKGMTGLFQNVGKQLTDSLTNMGISAAMNLGMQGAMALGKKLFKSEGKETNKQRDEWIKANYGSQAELSKLAKQAGITDAALHRLYTTGKVKDFEAQAKNVTKAIEEMQAVEEKAKANTDALAKGRTEFLKAFGGSEEQFRRLAKQAGITDEAIQHLFDTDKIEDFDEAAQAAQEQLDRFAREQEEDAERVEKAIEKYGIAWDELGKNLQQKKLDETAKDLIEDWRVLIDAGVDMAKVNAKMSDHIEDYLDLAKKTGAEVPAAMRPILQKMIEQGVLTDSAGRKIENLEDLGVTFAQTMTQGFDRVVEKLEELIRKIGGIGTALDDIPDVTEKVIRVRTEHVDDEGETTHGGGTDPDPDDDVAEPYALPESYLDPLNFAKGTGGRFLDFGEGTPAILHGHERVVTGAEARTENADVAAMVSAVQGLQTVLLRAVRENALQMRDQVLLARA